MKSVLNHLELNIKNKQCFMCLHFKGDSSLKGYSFNKVESCRITNTVAPFNWEKYYINNKHPQECLSECKGNNFKEGGKYYNIYKKIKKDYD